LDTPLYEIETAYVSGWRHAIEYGKAEESSGHDIAHHILPVAHSHFHCMVPEPVEEGGKQCIATSQDTQPHNAGFPGNKLAEDIEKNED
jgi:hypothetical protein